MTKPIYITPDLFRDPDSNSDKMRESGIEDTFKNLFMQSDEHFWVNKIDNSDGVIRYTDDSGKLLFWGVQECKLHKTANYHKQLVQALVYIHLRIQKYPHLKDSARLLFLSNEKFANIVYLDNILDSNFWWQFQFLYEGHCHTRYGSVKGSASNFYAKCGEVQALIADYAPRFRGAKAEFKDEFNFGKIVENILENCL